MEQVDVVVVGGGLAGLTAAATAAGAGAEHSVLLVDGTSAGGRAATAEVGRFRFNRGAHALYRSGAARPVLDRLGVQVRGVRPPLKGSQGRLRDQVGLLPGSTVSLVRSSLIDARAKLSLGRLLSAPRRWRPAELADRTAAEWFDELGLHGDARLVAEMLARLTTYAADLDRVSADLVASQIQAALGDGVEYLHGGWVMLVEGLRAAAERHGARLELTSPVQRIVPDDGGARVVLGRSPGGSADPAGDGDDGERVVLARRVVLAAGTPEANAALLPERPVAWTGLGPPSRVACLDLGLADIPETAVLLGVDRPFYLIRHAPPAELAPPGAALVHTLWYLRSGEDPSPAEARAALSEHCRMAGIEPDQAEEQRYLHRMVVCGALAVPENGGLVGRPSVTDTGAAEVLVAGDWVGPDGHLADAAIASGARAAQHALHSLDHAPLIQPVGGTTA